MPPETFLSCSSVSFFSFSFLVGFLISFLMFAPRHPKGTTVRQDHGTS